MFNFTSLWLSAVITLFDWVDSDLIKNDLKLEFNFLYFKFLFLILYILLQFTSHYFWIGFFEILLSRFTDALPFRSGSKLIRWLWLHTLRIGNYFDSSFICLLNLLKMICDFELSLLLGNLLGVNVIYSSLSYLEAFSLCSQINVLGSSMSKIDSLFDN